MEIENKEYYQFNKPENKKRTQQRLMFLKKLGMSEVGLGQFGIKGIISGIYIEIIWNYSEKQWIEYTDWIKSVVK